MAQIPLRISLPTGEQIQAGINIRPFAVELLSALSSDFEVIIFTASHSVYADAVLDLLDPDRKLIHHRLYRENCVCIDGVYIKDLRILGHRDLQNIVIIDNAVHSFAYQIENGVPIMSWYDDRNDRELLKLIDYLKVLATVPNMIRTNSQVFKLWDFYNQYANAGQD